jgi:hypothetical protein
MRGRLLDQACRRNVIDNLNNVVGIFANLVQQRRHLVDFLRQCECVDDFTNLRALGDEVVNAQRVPVDARKAWSQDALEFRQMVSQKLALRDIEARNQLIVRVEHRIELLQVIEVLFLLPRIINRIN